MTRQQTLAGYAVIAVAVVAYQWSAWRRGDRATLGQFVATLATWRLTRWPLLAGWLWLGWHLFVRVDWR